MIFYIILFIFFYFYIMPIDYFKKYIKYKNKYIILKTIKGGSTNKNKIILFSADWCGHCKRFKPVWEKLKKELSNKYEFVNYKDNSKEVAEWGIKGFPTIYVANKDTAAQYYGERTPEAIKEFLKEVKF